ncbi:MAG: LamG-like jellyroll fold domain-containing protein [Bacteroidota bacterium]
MKNLLLLLTILSVQIVNAQPCITNTKSIQLNGNSSSADFATDNNLAITDSITVEAWINASVWSAIPSEGTILCKHSWTAAGGEQGYVLRAGGTGVLSWNFAGLDINSTPVSWVETVSGTSLTLNTWYHVAGTYDGSVARIYINGVLAGSTSFAGSIVASTAFPARIGNLSDDGVGNPRYWNGKLDEIRVWHRALPQSEIAAHMNMHLDTATTVGLVGYWRFNEGTGTASTDLSGSGNNANLLSTTWSSSVPFNDLPTTPIVQNFPQLLNCLATGVSYQWNLAGNPVTGATSQQYTPTVTGSYTVTVTSPAGCSATSTPVTFTVGIDEHSLDNYFTVSPNPTKGDIQLNVLQSTTYTMYEINDLQGRIIFSGSVQIGTQTISLNNLSKGIYLLVLEGEDRIDARRIVVD